MESREYLLLIDLINARFDDVNARFDGIDTRLAGIDTQLVGIDTRLARHDTSISAFGHEFGRMHRRFDEAEATFAAFRSETTGHFDAIYRRFERLEQEYHALTEGMRRLERGDRG
jgi:archaellum component FlaC